MPLFVVRVSSFGTLAEMPDFGSWTSFLLSMTAEIQHQHELLLTSTIQDLVN
jgi:hypothetical protein